jgi:hydrogenase maturation protease
MSRPDGELLILGIGNLLMRDEGVGVHVARYLTQAEAIDDLYLPPDSSVVDGGTLGLDLLPMLDGARAVIFVDAVDFGAEPGHVQTLKGRQLEHAFGNHVSPHQVGTADLLALGRLTGALPDRVALVGIQPEAVDLGLEMSPVVEAMVPVAATVVAQQAWTFTREEG